MGFFYSFTDTLLHSIWQAALLAAVYFGACALMPRLHPLQKRNILIFLPAFQLIISAVTFIVFYNSGTISETFTLSRFSPLSFTGLGAYSAPVFYSWCAIVVFRSAITFYKWQCFRNLYSASLLRTSAELRVFTDLRAFHLGIKRKVSVWYSRHVHVPLTFGFFKPVILLPFSLAAHLSMQETEAIILHELAHIKSRDWLLNWLLIFSENLYFFNPFIRLIANKARLEREKNCDVQVVNFNYPDVLYAGALLKIARFRNALPDFQLGAVKKRPELLQRIKFFSQEENLLFRSYRSGLAAAFLLPLVIAASVFFLPALKEKTFSSTKAVVLPTSENDSPVTYHISGNTATIADNILTSTHAKASVKKTEDLSAKDNYFDYTLADPVFTAMPVSFDETQDSSKEFIYEIETPKGKVTQSFRISFSGGRTVVEPQWMKTETRPDSSHRYVPGAAIIDSIQ